MPAGKRLAPFAAKWRRRVMQSSAELDDIARARPVPVVLEHRIHDKPRPKEHAEYDEERLTLQQGPVPHEGDSEKEQPAQDERSGDPGGGAVEQRPGHLLAPRPMLARAGVEEESRQREVELPVCEDA